MNNVVDLFGKPIEGEVLDNEPTAEDVYEEVKTHNFKYVLVIGVDEEGVIGFSTNLGTAAKTLLVTEKFKQGLLNERL